MGSPHQDVDTGVRLVAVLHYNFHSHPKIVGLSKAAIGCYALALSYASGNLTDGFVPDSYVRSLDPNHQSLTKRSPFARLIAAGLVNKVDGGYAIRDYLDYNPTKAQVVEKRRLARERMERVRANTGTKKPKRSREQQEDVTANVRRIGQLQDQELRPGSPSTVLQDAGIPSVLSDESSTVAGDELAARRAGRRGLEPIGGSLAPILEELLKRAQPP